jgi:hypothetical protein
MTTQTSISREHARKILERAGWDEESIEDELGRGTDYWLDTDEDGEESLIAYGEEEPVAVNGSRMSWLNPW